MRSTTARLASTDVDTTCPATATVVRVSFRVSIRVSIRVPIPFAAGRRRPAGFTVCCRTAGVGPVRARARRRARYAAPRREPPVPRPAVGPSRSESLARRAGEDAGSRHGRGWEGNRGKACLSVFPRFKPDSEHEREASNAVKSKRKRGELQGGARARQVCLAGHAGQGAGRRSRSVTTHAARQYAARPACVSAVETRLAKPAAQWRLKYSTVRMAEAEACARRWATAP